VVLLQVEEHHPPPVIEALFRGALVRKGDIAVHFAAMLMFLHGRAAEAFDWDQRPFYLTFHTEDPAERAAAFRELCARVGVESSAHNPELPIARNQGSLLVAKYATPRRTDVR